MTVVAIHQPNYLPWLGYFGKIMDSDVFILLDNVQYSKNSYTNRVQIKGSQGVQWLTQPIATSGHFGQEIRHMVFARTTWGASHLKTLHTNYARAPYARHYLPRLAGLLEDPGPTLAVCNERLIRWACDSLELSTRLLRASDVSPSIADPTERLVRLVDSVGGDTYLSGSGGFDYQDLAAFEQVGIRVTRSRNSFPDYPQLWAHFAPGLSIVDLLLNSGPESASIIRRGR